jgi:DNA polymerase elongation subunit (family B)
VYQNVYVDSPRGEPSTVYVFDDRDGVLRFPWSQFDYAYVPDPGGQYNAMTGERVSKTKRYIRGNSRFFETDLPKETRVLTDLYLDDDTPSTGHVVMFFDIEVSMENGIPDVQNTNNEITSIALYDPTTDVYTVVVLDKESIYETRKTDAAQIIFKSSETELLYTFLQLYEEMAPTIITGWNSNQFDVPYLYNRIHKLCGPVVASRLSPIGKIRYSERYERYKIAGVSSLDYLDLYKKFTYAQQPNYRLDTIGRVEVGQGKVEYDGSLDQLFRDDLDKFIEYNLQDVRIIVELDKKLKLIELVRGICHVGHVPYEDYSLSSRFLEGTIVTYLHRKGIVVTNKPQDVQEKMAALDRGEQGFVGAYVKDPVPGVYDWVYSLDLQSLYPSIIMSLNISPETRVGIVHNYDVEKHLKKEITTYVVEERGVDATMEMDYDTFMTFLTDNRLTISSNGVLYITDRKGIIPEVLETWFAQRAEFKNLMKQYTATGDLVQAAYYDQRQHIQKIFLNSLYGVLGLPAFRFYDLNNAEAVTASGQSIIKYTSNVANVFYKKQLTPVSP